MLIMSSLDLDMYKFTFLHSGSKASNSFLSPCMFETVARTLFFTLPKLR